MSTATLSLAEQSRAENILIAQGLKRHDAELLDRLIVHYQHRLLRYLLYPHRQPRARRRPLPGNLDARACSAAASTTEPPASTPGSSPSRATWSSISAASAPWPAWKRCAKPATTSAPSSAPAMNPLPWIFIIAAKTATARRRGSAHARPAASRGAGAALPRGAFAGRDREGHARPALHRQIAPLSRTRRTEAAHPRVNGQAGGQREGV